MSDIDLLMISKKMKTFADFIKTAFNHSVILRRLQLYEEETSKQTSNNLK